MKMANEKKGEIILSGLELRGVVINGYFTVRLTVSVDPVPPPPSYGQLFVKWSDSGIGEA